MLQKEDKRAHRSPHLKKHHIPGTDTIDKLDDGPLAQYHHEGPYDATLLARNISFTNSPVAAVADSNREALRATPRENIKDSIERHRPLDGVAAIPPGGEDRFGRRFDYQEGDNMMIVNGGDYKRWPGVVSPQIFIRSVLFRVSEEESLAHMHSQKYHPDDIKGKGEPSYSIEKALKEHKLHDGEDETGGRYRSRSDAAQTTGIEMTDRPRASHEHPHRMEGEDSWNDAPEAVRRSNSKRLSGGLKKLGGSLRRRREEGGVFTKNL